MTLKFIIDTQLPHQLAAYLRRNKFDAVHTTDTFQGHLLRDSEIVNLAIE
jgi:predicted nuclease of predicted toxin-antitoxin system